MEDFWRKTLWAQYGAAIDSLANVIRACPEPLWGDRSRYPEFWYVAYHTLFFLDLYSSPKPFEAFVPPAPFTLAELDPAGVLPDRVYSQAELLAYLDHGRRQAKAELEALSEESARRRRVFLWIDLTAAELIVYNLRHVQHHTAQLNLLLRQAGGEPPRWVRRAADADAPSS